MDADAKEFMDDEQWISHIADLQAAHSSHVAGMVYGRSIHEQAGSTNHRREMFRLSSTDWHQFLGFASTATTPSILGKRKRAPWEDEAEVSRIERRHQLATMDMEAAAQRMTGQATMRFWGVQDPAIRAIHMLFMVPAFAAPGGTTIVVVPLVALRADMQRRCRELGISCVPWESRRPPDAASIVLVTPESAVSPDFQTFLNQLRWMRRLDRIMIDECHVMVWLTATLPPSMEDELCRRMKHDRTAMTIYRAQTSRPNVAYRWIESEAVVAFIQDRIQQVAGGKVIIYANIIGQVTAMTRVLGPVITAMSALGMGVDIPNIRSIIHIGTPRTLLDYAQESGRAGRDGQRSEAIIIQPAGWDAPAPWMEGVLPEDQERVADYMGVVEGVGCRRVVLDWYLDGVVDGYQRQHCQDQDGAEQACDGCDPDWEGREVDPPGVGRSQVPREAGSMIQRDASPEAPCEAGRQRPQVSRSQVPREGASEAPREAGTMAGRDAPLAAPCEAGSMIQRETPPKAPREAPAASASPTPSHDSFCSQPSIPIGVWHVQQAQTQQWAAMDIQQQQHRTQQGLDEEMAQAECMQWQDQCYICAMQGYDSSHELYSCHQPHSQAAQAWMIYVQQQV
ncbi:uncharacterized protein CDV56_101272 [Aspergillus thermomutatus]|uniref:DNA 3'-5' helicase n=1 Tax=Aspergillus thermomutatus TaxID=41047 RepID=A0A397FXE8_ASPTH|nr:uncharacterized protein CDV56_101272 [Aspergillus thermomutatus]RHZ43207.1 hypothetical protein CDV56_101272 [Aspergillus thermomutatus]